MDLKDMTRAQAIAQHNRPACDDVMNVCAQEYALFSS